MADYDHDQENDHEQTPLLQDQDEENPQEHPTHHGAHALVNDIRDVIEDQIPNGHHHIAPTTSPKRIHVLLPKIFALLNSLVDSASVEDDIVTDDVVEFISGLGKEVVYGLLRYVETCLEEGERDVGRKKLLERRADIAQVAAAEVVKAFVEKDMMATYCHVLAMQYYAAGEEVDTAENAIEIAIRVHATGFLANVEVQRCVQALWNGLILQTEDDECRVRFVEYSGVRRSRDSLWEWIDVGRLNVPKYQNNMKIAMFITFLTMYTIVVNNRTDNPSPFEWAVYVFVCGYIFEEFRLIFEGGTAFFLGSLWHWINIISYFMFMVSFAFRFVACYVATKKETTIAYNDIAYDLLALLAVFLWVKTLSLLDGIQYFGTMVMVLQKMLKDGIMFFWLLTWVFIGFFQSFYALMTDANKDVVSTTRLLVRGFLQDPDWDLAISIDKNYGFWLFALYLFLTSIILLNLLIALFNSSYTNITDSAEKEYLALFTFKVFSYLKSPDQFPYAAPFNLIEVFFVIPWSVITSKHAYRQLNRVVMGALFFIPMAIIARSERKRYMRLRDISDDDIQGGRRRYRRLTRDDVNLDDMFMLATQSSEDNEGEAVTDRAATIAEAEEGIISAAEQDVWKSTLSPLETFDDFRERRAREKEAKAAAALKDAKAAAAQRAASHASAHAEASHTHDSEEDRTRQNTSRTADTCVASSSTYGQLTDTLVQSLVASLARMEVRQQEMETLLQKHVDLQKEVNAIAEARGVSEPAEQEEEEEEEEEEEQE